MPKISVGRSDEDFEEYGLKGTGVIGRHLVGENEEAHKANPIHFDLAKPHVVGLFGKRGTGKCLLPDQKILTESGLKRIEEVFEEGRKKGCTELVSRSEELYRYNGPEVQSVDGSFSGQSDGIKAVYRKRVDEKLLEITTKSGRTIKVTKEHPLLSIRGWKNSDALEEGERIGIPRKIDLESTERQLSIPKSFDSAKFNSLNRRESKVLEAGGGQVSELSDGTGSFQGMIDKAEERGLVRKESEEIKVTAEGAEVLEKRKEGEYYRYGKSRPIKIPDSVSKELAEFLSLLIAEGHEQKINDSNYRIIFTNENQRLLERFEELGKNLFDLEFRKMDESSVYANSRALEELLRENKYPAGSNSFNKEIPDFLLASRREVVTEFLQKYFDSEGNVTDQQIELTTASRDVANSISYMLLRFGVIARILSKEKYAANTEEQKVRSYYQLTISGGENLKKFREKIDFSLERKSEKLSEIAGEANTNVDTVPCGDKIRDCREAMGADRTQIADYKQSLKAYEDGKYAPSREKLKEMTGELKSQHERIKQLEEKLRRDPEIDDIRALVNESGVLWKELSSELGYSGSDKKYLSYQKYKEDPEKIAQPLLELFESKHDLEKSGKLLEKLEELAESDVYWDEIEDIREIEYEGWVYDVTVEDNHSFTGGFGGIYCHNSYSMGTFAEELQTSDVSDNCSSIIIDPMGIYWSMKRPNDRAASLLENWDMNPDAFDVKVFIPEGKVQEFEEREMPYDDTFTLRPEELSAGEWGMAFGIQMNSETGILLERVITTAKENLDSFTIDQLLEVVDRFDFPDDVKNRLQNRFRNAQEWGIFGEESSMDDFTKRGELSVIDVSAFGEMREGSGVRSLVVGLLAKKILRRRMTARRIEEIDEMEGISQNEMPIVWMMIDEAHEFLPAEGETAASHPLMRWVKIGREPGVSLVLATQQPAKLHPDALSQCDVILSHRLTSKQDIDSLGNIMHTYMRHDIQHYIDALPDSKGAGLLLDDNSERIYPVQMRPRKSWHAGGTPDAFED